MIYKITNSIINGLPRPRATILKLAVFFYDLTYFTRLKNYLYLADKANTIHQKHIRCDYQHILNYCAHTHGTFCALLKYYTNNFCPSLILLGVISIVYWLDNVWVYLASNCMNVEWGLCYRLAFKKPVFLVGKHKLIMVI